MSPMLSNLRDALEMARQRFRSRQCGPHEGMLRDPAIVAEISRLFGPEQDASNGAVPVTAAPAPA